MKILGRMSLLFAFIAAISVPAALVWAQDYPLQTGDLQVDGGGGGEVVLAPGDPVTITGGGFAPGSDVVITIESEPVVLGETTADATGDFSTTVVLPAALPAGGHTIKATGDDARGGVLVLSQEVTVAGASGEGGLPVTGVSGGDLLLVAGLLLLVGGGVLFAIRRRQAVSA